MSDVFFNQLGIPRPDYQLDINSGLHGSMTGRMLIQIEAVLLAEKPKLVLVYGDTNSTLAGAMAAAKLHIPVVHIEAGLRSFNMKMPEEINRILTDRLSSVLFCPTDTAVNNLKAEGFPFLTASAQKQSIYQVGDVMQDAVMLFSTRVAPPAEFNINECFVLATVHRAENTDEPQRLEAIVDALNYIHENIAPVVLPIHPRTNNVIKKAGLRLKVHMIEPVGYFEMLWLLQHAGLVLTDSGGVQKEAFFFGKACVTIRDQTEWIELVQLGANQLVDTDIREIIDAVRVNLGRKVVDEHGLYGGGRTAERIVRFLI